MRRRGRPCAQFEHELRLDIRVAVSVFELTDLLTLISKCRIFEANAKGKTVDTKGSGSMKQDRRPPRFLKGPYSGSSNSQYRGSLSQERSNESASGSDSFKGPIKCFRRSSASTNQWPESRGSTGLSARPCIGPKPCIPMRVFAMSGVEASQSEELIEGKCVIKGRLLDVLYDLGAMHSFVSVKCVKSLGLYVIELLCNVVVTTPRSKPVATSWVCLGCFIMVHGREFEMDLICLSLSQLDVILGMDWLAANHVLLDCREKTLIFNALMTEIPRLLSQGAWENTVSTKAFMVMFSLEAESGMEPEYIPVVRDFLEVLLKDVSELLPKRDRIRH
ncbi:uncharacterized protein LOC113874306 [Abrus precatorius]|uniref:Uncharacterized protein LOC113874306 n=1 Tax=Abrus precatorius TaxID=3816 RepID=A0A8B8ML57_ABRPR|nr:uncharacterized protein LOC113874306 [Abrus precatorius]